MMAIESPTFSIKCEDWEPSPNQPTVVPVPAGFQSQTQEEADDEIRADNDAAESPDEAADEAFDDEQREIEREMG